MPDSRPIPADANAPMGPAPEPVARLVSLDAFRGAIMLLMASRGFGFSQVAQSLPDSPVWTVLGRQCDHAAWAGCTLWDLIQPAFMFMVGVALPCFIPSLATMVLGLIAGRLLRSDAAVRMKVARLVVAGVAGLGLGLVLDRLGVCPIIKRIWTPAWTLYSAGWVALLLAGFVVVLESRGRQRWAFPLVVAGLNPITLYCLWQLSSGFLRDNLKRHLGPGVFQILGDAFAPLVERSAVLFALWCVLFWMYRRKLFIRI